MLKLLCLILAPRIIIVNGLINPINFIKSQSYPAEKHHITADDGYITTVHRIPRGKTSIIGGDPILVSHGTGASSSDFLILGSKVSLGFILADAGYDVWLGNARGNSYSPNHLKLDRFKNEQAFYNFSWHEIGCLDYTAQIDYILNITGKNKLHYLGVSQAGTSFYAMASTRPEYNDKIKVAVLLASTAIMKNMPSQFYKDIADVIFEIENLLKLMGVYHVPVIKAIRKFMFNLCSNSENYKFCQNFLSDLIGFDDRYTNMSRLTPIFKSTPSDFSSKCLLHFGQIIKSGEFRQYNFGPKGNINQYGTIKPPKYNLSLVTAPIAMFNGKNDAFISLKDIDIMVKALPNVVYNYVVPYDKFNHVDFLYGYDVYTEVYPEVIKILKLY